MRIDEEKLIYSCDEKEKDCHDYLYGDCHLFAYAAQRHFRERAKIFFCWQHYEEDTDDEFGYLAHAYVKIDDKYIIDCRGINTEKKIIREYVTDPNFYSIFEVKPSFVKDYMESGILDNFCLDEQKQIIKFIQDNIKFYEK